MIYQYICINLNNNYFKFFYRGYHSQNRHFNNQPEMNFNDPPHRHTMSSMSNSFPRPLLPPPLLENPIFPSRTDRKPHAPPTRHMPPPHVQTPLPGTQEYTDTKIQLASDFIKRQLNLEGESFNMPPPILPNLSCRNEPDRLIGNRYTHESTKTIGLPQKKKMTKPQKPPNSPELYNIKDITDKILHHISNMNYSKKMNLVNRPGDTGYDFALEQIHKQQRLELSRALKDMSKREDSSDCEVINSIIPDIGIKIEDLPREIIEQLSFTLDCDLER